MGSYGIGSGRLMACIAEEHHDEHGLVWPVTVAPYQVHLVVLAGRGSIDTRETAEKLYTLLQQEHIEVLYDDRDESPGVKFNDADLIGIPIRLTVSERALKQGGIEFKRRSSKERSIVPQEEVILFVKNDIKAMETEIKATIREVQYSG